MSSGVRKILAVLTILIIVFGWFATIFGIGGKGAIKDKIMLGLDIKGGVYVVMEAKTDVRGEELKQLMEQTQAVIERRVNQMGLSEPVVTVEGQKRIRVELPGAENSEEAIKAIGRTAQLKFVMSDGSVALDGSQVKNAGVAQDSRNGGYAITLEFTREGTRAFAEATEKAFHGKLSGMPNEPISIVLDGEVISAPRVDAVISNGKAEITAGRTGGFPQEEAIRTAALIRGGALPVELEEVDTSIQTAKIGFNQLEVSVMAGLIGLLLIFIIMFVNYRIMGLASNIALLLYVLLVLWIMVAIGSVLTLPGIAGLILSVGMAVDANVIIFSRIKEEICNGKSIRVSVEAGFKRALSTILDSQITTIIAAIVLYQSGSGPVKGFAMTLMIGILASIFTAVAVTQLFLGILAGSPKLARKSLFGVSEDNRPVPSMKRTFRFIRRRKIYYLITAVILVAGLGIGFIRGFNYGIDFTGGTMIQLDMERHVPSAEVKKVLKEHGVDGEIVYAGEDNSQVVIRTTQSMDNRTRARVIDSLEQTFGITDKNVLAVEQFGPAVGKELRTNAMNAVVIAALGMLVYIIFRFEWKFGLAAIAGVLHDVLMVIAFYGIFRVTINSPFIAGVLTVVGYSINDTIVVFDRIRENLGIMKKNNTVELIDASVNQTLGRSVLTSFTTIVTMIPLYIMASSTIREFTLPLMIGVLVGCASSIFIASPLYYDLCQRTGGPRYKAKAKKAKK